MKNLKRWPDNVEVFHIGRWPVHRLNQEIMRAIRTIADKRGWTFEGTINEAMREFVERCEAERELETKLIQFPK
jgi:hypothetical protein